MKQKVSKKPCLPGVPTAAHRQPAFTSMRTNQAIGRKRVSENVVAIRSSMLLDPISLVATMAHELGHVILLGGNFLTHDTPDQEPMTDLLTGLRVWAFSLQIQPRDSCSFRMIGAPDGRPNGWAICPNPSLAMPWQNSLESAVSTNHRGQSTFPQTYARISTNRCGWRMQNPLYVPTAEPIG